MTKNNLIGKKFKFLLEKNEAYRAESEDRLALGPLSKRTVKILKGLASNKKIIKVIYNNEI